MIVVYTAIFRPIRDPLPLQLPPGCEQSDDLRFVCFAEGEVPKGPWEFRPRVWWSPVPRRTARYHKINAHKLFPEAEYSLWLDGNIALRQDPRNLIAAALQDCDLAVSKHRERDCLFAELRACIKLRKDTERVMREQVARYKSEGYPPNNGMVETGVLLRKHTPDVQAFNEIWWNEISNGSLRDQLSFNYCAWKLGFSYGLLPGTVTSSPYFSFTRHR